MRAREKEEERVSAPMIERANTEINFADVYIGIQARTGLVPEYKYSRCNNFRFESADSPEEAGCGCVRKRPKFTARARERER